MPEIKNQVTVDKPSYILSNDLDTIPNIPLKPLQIFSDNKELWGYDGHRFIPYYFVVESNCLWVVPANSEAEAKNQFLQENRVSFLLNSRNELMSIFRTLANS